MASLNVPDQNDIEMRIIFKKRVAILSTQIFENGSGMRENIRGRREQVMSKEELFVKSSTVHKALRAVQI